MASTYVAAQLYTLRDSLKTPADIATTFKALSDIGYGAVQVSGVGEIADAELKKLLDDNGLNCVATHISMPDLRERFDQVVEQHKTLDCDYTAIGALPAEDRKDADSFARAGKELSEFAAKLSEQGITLGYHNHSFEFVRFGDTTGLDLVLGDDKNNPLQAEIDTYWVQHGGGDPAAWILKYSGRIDVVHFKDLVMTPDITQVFAEVGEGNLNWARIIEACKKAGTKYYAVEQDICQRPPLESLKISLENLKKMGLN